MKKIISLMIAAAMFSGFVGNAYAEGWKKQGSAEPYTKMEPAAGDPTRAVMLDKRDVEMLQKNLMDRGYATGPIDGIMGPKTSKALSNFQRDNGLSVTGTATPGTLTELGMMKKRWKSPEHKMQDKPSEMDR